VFYLIQKICLVISLDTGKDGKGGIIHKLAKTTGADVILKFGGGHDSHGVVNAQGMRFNFAHWGCGTLEEIPTYMMPGFIAIPRTIVDEGKALQLLGIRDPYQSLAVDPSVLCVTSFHQIAAQLLELSRHDRPQTTWASGVDEAYRLSQELGEKYSLHFQDLYNNVVLEQKLDAIMRYYQFQFINFRINRIRKEDRARAQDLLRDLHHNSDLIRQEFLSFTDIICDSSLQLRTATEAICYYGDQAIAECSQGVLADAEHGLQPHDNALRTLPQFTEQTLRRAGFTGTVTRLGVTKAFILRHGGVASPTTTDQPVDDFMRYSISSDLVVPDPDEVAFRDRWQSKMQTGSIDFVLLQKAINLCGGPGAFDGLCVTWLDQVLKDGVWKYCDRYLSPYRVSDNGQTMEGQPEEVLPYISFFNELKYTTVGSDEFNQAINELFESKLGIPVRMISFGPKENDKIII